MTSFAGHRPGSRLAGTALGLLASAGILASTAATVLAVRATGAACALTPTAHQLGAGQRGLLVVVLAALLPWAVAASRTEPRGRRRKHLLVAAAACAAPAAAALVIGLEHPLWRALACS